MSKQSEAKAGLNYRTEPSNCGNCARMTKEMILPKWMHGIQQYESEREKYMVERNLRCGLGGFAIKKTATCNSHLAKPVPDGAA